MDEVQEFCRRVIGPGSQAEAAAAQARAEGHRERVAMLAAAAQACRERAERQATAAEQAPPAAAQGPPEAGPDVVNGSPRAQPARLSDAVARELAQAVASLPERQREALALRELLRLSHQQIAVVMQIDPAAVAPLLARARLRLRAARRGTEIEAGGACPDRDRALRILACRQDSEPLTGEDDAWVHAHLADCPACDMAHAAMLEASVCYRAWPREQPLGSAVPAG